jgi:hypothetical protein
MAEWLDGWHGCGIEQAWELKQIMPAIQPYSHITI